MKLPTGSTFFALAALLAAPAASQTAPAGFVSLFNGRDLSGWKIPAGDNGHWKVVNGVIDYDARSEAAGDKSLWTAKDYTNFVLRVDWRLKETPYISNNVRVLLPDGSEKLNEKGEPIRITMPDSDSGIMFRSSNQVNIWCWPVGSGELWSTRRGKDASPADRAGATPRMNADRNIGEWNTFEITLRGDRVKVVLNGHTVIENGLVPGLPPKGPIGLQHHGRWENGKYTGPPSLVQFRNLFIKEI